MANAYEIPGFRFTGETNTAIEPHRFVCIGSNGLIDYAAGNAPIGVSYTGAKAGEPISVCTQGIVMVEAESGQGITAGGAVYVGTEGKASMSGSYQIGTVVTGVSPDQSVSGTALISVLL